jgi:glycosyltransferase involved in cell wall biosynthesis
MESAAAESRRLAWTSLGGVSSTGLPPQRSGDRPRILLITLNSLGWRTYENQLASYFPNRPDIEVSHLALRTPFWMRLLNAKVPKTRRTHLLHPILTWDLLIRWWIHRRRLPLDDFDVVFIAPHTVGVAIARRTAQQGATRRHRLAVSCDTTSPAYAWTVAGSVGGTYQSRLHPTDRFELTIFRAADLITVWAAGVTKSLVDDYEVDPSRVFVSSPVVDERLIQLGHDSARPRNAVPRIVFVGNDWDRKGGPRLLRWHQERLADRAELHVFSSRAPIDPTCKNVTWHGSMANDRLVGEFLPTMDLFVFPTTLDSVPFAIVEAQSAGLPVVSYRVGFISDLVIDGETGVLCNPGDEAAFFAQAERLIDDVALRERMSAAARKSAERFQKNRTLGALFDELAQLANSKISLTERTP